MADSTYISYSVSDLAKSATPERKKAVGPMPLSINVTGQQDSGALEIVLATSRASWPSP